jgi:hypothetical protein
METPPFLLLLAMPSNSAGVASESMEVFKLLVA